MSYEDYKFEEFRRMEKIDENEHKINDLQSQYSKIEKNKKNIQEIKSKSKYLSVCGYKYNTNIKRAVIPYDSLVHPLTQSPGSGHTFNATTGQFTAGLDGVYSVSWVVITDDITAGENRVGIYLRKNGVKLQDTLHQSH